jgi:hypothetical protein
MQEQLVQGLTHALPGESSELIVARCENAVEASRRPNVKVALKTKGPAALATGLAKRGGGVV